MRKTSPLQIVGPDNLGRPATGDEFDKITKTHRFKTAEENDTIKVWHCACGAWVRYWKVNSGNIYRWQLYSAKYFNGRCHFKEEDWLVKDLIE